jgi:hypothetical protein
MLRDGCALRCKEASLKRSLNLPKWIRRKARNET